MKRFLMLAVVAVGGLTLAGAASTAEANPWYGHRHGCGPSYGYGGYGGGYGRSYGYGGYGGYGYGSGVYIGTPSFSFGYAPAFVGPRYGGGFGGGYGGGYGRHCHGGRRW